MKKYLNILLGLSLAGLLFSGYLSGVKIITKTCALGETCPLFLGYPACWYGFFMYLILFISVVIMREKPKTYTKLMHLVAIVSLVGFFFSDTFVISDINTWMTAGDIPKYTLILPTCAYGLIFYFVIFVVTARALLKEKNSNR